MPKLELLTKDQIRDLAPADLPAIMFSFNYHSWLSSKITRRTKGFYSHVMLMIRPGWVASQDIPFYREVEVDEYLTDHHRLKLITGSQWNQTQRVIIRHAVEQELAAPRYRRAYDWLGIIGQALGVRSINIPYRRYCSERVATTVGKIEGELRMMKHASPADLNRYTKTARDRYRLLGYYDAALADDFAD